MAEQAIASIAFVGTGNIGGPMAARLQRCGWRVTACDIAPANLAPLAAAGLATTARAAHCASCDLVLVMVVSEAQVEAVVNGPDGLLAGLDRQRPPTLVVMSSVRPAFVRDLAAQLGPLAIPVVDAAVSGGAAGAEQGTLSIMAGGPAPALARLQPVFATLGTLFPCGDTGAGVAVKAINNLLGITNIYLMAEAVNLARGQGLDPDGVAAIMEASSGRNAGTADLARYRRAWGEFSANPAAMAGALATSRKDFSVARAMAEDLGLELPLVRAMLEGFKGLDAEVVGRLWAAASVAEGGGLG